MQEKRRHQRIRFGQPPAIRIGHHGAIAEGSIENLSLSGLMLRTSLKLQAGRRIGCEFSVFGSPLIDIPALVMSAIGDLYGVRFEPGPIAQIVLEDAIAAALAEGHASILNIHEAGGRKIMRIAGGLNGALRNDFMYSLTRVGVDEIDVGGVTAVDGDGLALCLEAQGRYGVGIGERSACFAEAWLAHLGLPADLGAGL